MKPAIENWKLILQKVQVSMNLFFHCAKFEIDKHQFWSSFYEENIFKPC